MRKLYVISWFDSSTLKHLRFHFSFYLLPVFLFALSQVEEVNWRSTAIAFVILHLFVFPSSNGYNSYQDKDTTSIGGLKYPPAVSGNLFYATLLMDIFAIGTGLLISVYFSMAVLVFVLVSRAYSFRSIRLKRFPVLGFLTVFIFQGAFVYLMSLLATSTFFLEVVFSSNHLLGMLISSLFIGSMFPLTQIYQHEADKNDGVISISYLLGYRGTFVFSAILFIAATILMAVLFMVEHQLVSLGLFIAAILPVIVRLVFWFGKVKKDSAQANFENTMAVNLLTSTCMNIYFLILILNHYEFWF